MHWPLWPPVRDCYSNVGIAISESQIAAPSPEGEYWVELHIARIDLIYRIFIIGLTKKHVIFGGTGILSDWHCSAEYGQRSGGLHHPLARPDSNAGSANWVFLHCKISMSQSDIPLSSCSHFHFFSLKDCCPNAGVWICRRAP